MNNWHLFLLYFCSRKENEIWIITMNIVHMSIMSIMNIMNIIITIIM